MRGAVALMRTLRMPIVLALVLAVLWALFSWVGVYVRVLMDGADMRTVTAGDAMVYELHGSDRTIYTSWVTTWVALLFPALLCAHVLAGQFWRGHAACLGGRIRLWTVRCCALLAFVAAALLALVAAACAFAVLFGARVDLGLSPFGIGVLTGAAKAQGVSWMCDPSRVILFCLVIALVLACLAAAQLVLAGVIGPSCATIVILAVLLMTYLGERRVFPGGWTMASRSGCLLEKSPSLLIELGVPLVALGICYVVGVWRTLRSDI